jgi:hypothetical protein
MEIVIVKFEEAEPATFPTLTTYDAEGLANDESIIIDRPLWLRLESYIARRWTPRQCVWTVQGPGTWEPHIGPVSNVTIDCWDSVSYTWDAVTLGQTPLGYCLPDSRTYRVTATVGDNAGDVPQSVTEAYLRLKAYVDEATAETIPVGVASHSLKLSDGYDESINRNPNYLARSMQFSGAGDLLRSYRRA